MRFKNPIILGSFVGTPLLCFALIGCEPDPVPSGKSASTASTPPTPVLDKAEQTRLHGMKADARKALRDEDLTLAGRIIAQGLEETRRLGRDLEQDTAAFQLLFGNLKRAQSDPLEAMRQYADAMAVFRVHNNNSGQFEVFMELALLEADRGDFAAADRQLAEAIAHSKSVDDKKLLARLELCRGRIDAGRMNHRQAAKRFSEAASLYAVSGEKLYQADALMLEANSEDAEGDGRLARAAYEKAHKLYTAENNEQGSVRAIHKLAALAERDGQFKKTRELLEQTRILYLSLGKQSDAAKVEQQINALPE